MQGVAARRVGAALRMAPAVARIGVRRVRQRSRPGRSARAVWTATTPAGVLGVDLDRTSVTLDGEPAGRFVCRVDLGTSTAECESWVDSRLAPPLVALVVSSVGAEVRRIAWFVPTGDAALEEALGTAGFACEGWSPPPLGDNRPHRQWAVLTGRR